MRLGAQLERIMTTVTGNRPHEAEIQEGDVTEEPAKVEIIEDDEGTYVSPPCWFASWHRYCRSLLMWLLLYARCNDYSLQIRLPNIPVPVLNLVSLCAHCVLVLQRSLMTRILSPLVTGRTSVWIRVMTRCGRQQTWDGGCTQR